MLVVGGLNASLSFGDQPSRDFCARTSLSSSWPLDLARLPENQIAFTNPSRVSLGIQGVCWWHSRLERNAIYLADFRPELPRLTPAQVPHLIRKLLRGKSILTIPGFKNLAEFTDFYRLPIQKELLRFRNRSILMDQAWTRKILRPVRLSSEKVAKTIEETQALLKAGDIPYWLLQMTTTEAHSWLILGIEETQTGARLTVLDSNENGQKQVVYETGDRFLDMNHVPFIDRKNETRRFRRLIQRACENPN